MSTNPPQDSRSRNADKFIVRLPDGMRDRISQAAKANKRTMNAEVVARLDASFSEQDDPLDPKRLHSQLDQLVERLTASINTDPRWSQAIEKALDDHLGSSQLSSSSRKKP